jgi:regulator of RNase E activity RraA
MPSHAWREAGDIVMGDQDGVIVIPQESEVRPILAKAR